MVFVLIKAYIHELGHLHLAYSLQIPERTEQQETCALRVTLVQGMNGHIKFLWLYDKADNKHIGPV